MGVRLATVSHDMKLRPQFPSLDTDSKASSSFVKTRLSPDPQDCRKGFLFPGSGILGWEWGNRYF